MSLASVTIDRTSLGKADLVIASDGSTYKLTEDGVGNVIQSVRLTMAPDPVDVDGTQIIGYARESTALPLEFDVLAATSAELATAKAELEEALYRLSYPVTRTVDGVSTTYAGGPCALVPKATSVDSGALRAHIETFAVTIPLPNPNGA